MEWQDIETAPRDGTRIDVWVIDPDRMPGYRVPDARWSVDREWVGPTGIWIEAMRDAITDVYSIRITHWRPCPTPPKPKP